MDKQFLYRFPQSSERTPYHNEFIEYKKQHPNAEFAIGQTRDDNIGFLPPHIAEYTLNMLPYFTNYNAPRIYDATNHYQLPYFQSDGLADYGVTQEDINQMGWAHTLPEVTVIGRSPRMASNYFLREQRKAAANRGHLTEDGWRPYVQGSAEWQMMNPILGQY